MFRVAGVLGMRLADVEALSPADWKLALEAARDVMSAGR